MIEIESEGVASDEVVRVTVRRIELNGAVPTALGLVSCFGRYAREPGGEVIPAQVTYLDDLRRVCATEADDEFTLGHSFSFTSQNRSGK